MGLSENDRIAVYNLLNILVEAEYSMNDISPYSKAKDELLCIMKRLDNVHKNNWRKVFQDRKAQIIIELIYLTINIIQKNGDTEKANGLRTWLSGVELYANRRLRTPNIQCPSYRPVTDFGRAGASASSRAHARSRASQAARGKHIYQHGLQQFESTSEGRSRQVLFTESRRRSGARPLHF